LFASKILSYVFQTGTTGCARLPAFVKNRIFCDNLEVCKTFEMVNSERVSDDLSFKGH